MPTCPLPWCGEKLPEDGTVRHPDHEKWLAEIAAGRSVFLAVRNADGSIDVYKWPRPKP